MEKVEKSLERRYLSADVALLELRGDDDEKPRIVGHAAVFNKLSLPLGFSQFRERILPGAFAESLAAGDDVRALVDHESSRILGRRKSGTLRVSEDAKGLLADIDPPDTSVGRDVLESIRRGDLDGMSFAFETVSDSWATEDGETVRTLEKVKVFDVSVVTYPAYTDTDVAVRSLKSWQNEAVQAAGRMHNMAMRLRLAESTDAGGQK